MDIRDCQRIFKETLCRKSYIYKEHYETLTEQKLLKYFRFSIKKNLYFSDAT